MSGPDQAQTVEATEGHERKRQQSQSRIRIPDLLCSIEAAEPPKAAPWESPRTEAVHLEGLSNTNVHSSPSLRSPSRQSRSWQYSDERRGSYYEHNGQSDMRSYREQASSSPVPPTSTHTASIRTPIHSSPRDICESQLHLSASSSNTSNSDIPDFAHPARRNFPLVERRDSGLGRRETDIREPGNSPRDQHYSSVSRDPLLRNAPGEHNSPFSTPPLTSSTGGYFTPRPTSSSQRSASLHTVHYQDNCHPYDVDQRPRTDRSKSDFALHQQNYGPYLDASPPLAPAPLFQPRKASMPGPQDQRLQHSPPTPQSAPLYSNASYLHEQGVPSYSTEYNRVYSPSQAPRHSFQGESRRASQGIILPPPESLHHSPESRKPARIYGLDAADTPSRPPLAPSASYGSKPLHDIPDGSETAYARRSSIQSLSDTGHRQMRESAHRYNTYPYDHRPSSSSPLASDQDYRSFRYQMRPIDRPQYDYSPRDENLRNPSAVPDTHASQIPSETRPYSPGSEPSPPIWYQQYAHAVPNKSQSRLQPQSRSSFSHVDPHGYAATARRESGYAATRHLYPQRALSPENRPSSRSSISAPGPSTPTAESDPYVYGHSVQMQRPRAAINTTTAAANHSVHPFDIPAPELASTPTSKSGTKRQHGQDDPFIPEDGVKAKRKRANAEQLQVLNAAFEKSYFPSTEERLRLSKQTKMCPRTVQIWFQNKRQSVKARSEAMDAAMARRRSSQAAALDRTRAAVMEEQSKRSRSQDESANGRSSQHYHHTQSRDQQQQLYSSHMPLHSQHQPPHGQNMPHAGEKRRNSGPLTPSDVIMDTFHMQLDDQDNYFSRKRRATVAQIEHNGH
ncbi:hypothetical protein BX616_001720 [Lobosporangium transversale]|nr:hypothetical protein BX616_001720 [Lobosporangium transversale]